MSGRLSEPYIIYSDYFGLTPLKIRHVEAEKVRDRDTLSHSDTQNIRFSFYDTLHTLLEYFMHPIRNLCYTVCGFYRFVEETV